MAEKSPLAVFYFAVLGLLTAAFGFAYLLVTIGIVGEFSYSILEIPGDMFGGGWGGIVLLSAGLFYLMGLKDFNEIHQFGKIVMASILIWLLAGCDIFAMITESIPGGDEGWFNTLSGFIETYYPPYTPAVLLLPFSLVVIYYIYNRNTKEEKE